MIEENPNNAEEFMMSTTLFFYLLPSSLLTVSQRYLHFTLELFLLMVTLVSKGTHFACYFFLYQGYTLSVD